MAAIIHFHHPDSIIHLHVTYGVHVIVRLHTAQLRLLIGVHAHRLPTAMQVTETHAGSAVGPRYPVLLAEAHLALILITL